MSKITKSHRNYRTRISRADLLDCYAANPKSWKTQAKQLGFEEISEQPQNKKQNKQKEAEKSARAKQAIKLQTNNSKRPAAQFYSVESYSGRSNQQLSSDKDLTAQAPEWYDPRNTYDPDNIQSDHTRSAPKQTLILSNARLFRHLQKQLNIKKNTPRIHVKKLMDNLSRGQWFAEIPYKQRKAWANKLILVIEKNRKLDPFDADINQLQKDLVNLRGQNNVDIRIIKNNYKKYHYTRHIDQSYRQYQWDFTDTQSRILIISDLACLEQNNGSYWEKWGKRFKQAGIKPTVLMPCEIPSWRKKLKCYFSPLYWSLQINHPVVYQPEKTEKIIETLLTLLAPASRVEPVLLRELGRSWLLDKMITTDVEARIWQHKAVKPYPSAFVFREGEQKDYREKFKQLPLEQQQEIQQLLIKHHQHLHPAVLHEEHAVWHSLAATDTESESKKSSQDFLQQTVATLKNSSKAANIMEWSNGLLERMDQTTLSQSHELKTIWGVLYEKALKKNKQIALPEGINFEDINWLVDQAQESRNYVLYQRQQKICIASKEHFDSLQRNSLILHFSSRMQTAQLQPSNHVFALPKAEQEITIPNTLTQQGFMLSSDNQYWKIQNKPRPTWASNAGHDQYGYFAEFSIDKVVQRLRWIPAGHFIMGSPVTEIDRSSSENQHAVKLTEGYWLADTACTQALWQAVMKDNPARFKESLDNPVEQVSWHDTQIFITRINQKISGLQLSLPTEAQWEYACRSNTTTPFNLGENITPEQVNYDGSYPYNNAKKGKDRGKTMPVKSMQAPNTWGLHEMHGNVWEWCQDWWGDYPVGETVNPHEANDGSRRVLRGGSWISNGRDVRSADRFAYQPDIRYAYTGFRLLGQSSQQASAEQESERNHAGQAEGRRQSGMMERIKGWFKS